MLKVCSCVYLVFSSLSCQRRCKHSFIWNHTGKGYHRFIRPTSSLILHSQLFSANIHTANHSSPPFQPVQKNFLSSQLQDKQHLKKNFIIILKDMHQLSCGAFLIFDLISRNRISKSSVTSSFSFSQQSFSLRIKADNSTLCAKLLW